MVAARTASAKEAGQKDAVNHLKALGVELAAHIKDAHIAPAAPEASA